MAADHDLRAHPAWRRLAMCAAIAAVLAPPAAGSALAASARRWQPNVHAAISYASHRRAHAIAFAVCTSSHCWKWHGEEAFPSASLLKPILLLAYLSQPSVRDRPLRSSERALLGPMIEHSDNGDATRVLGIVGTRALAAVGRRAGMRRFVPVVGIWGLSRIDADDQAHFFLHVDSLMPRRHRAYAMHLLASIVPSQRWGVARVAPRGWRLYFKGGWGSGTGFVDHQTALLVRGRERVALSILTYLDPSHGYGEATLQGTAARLLRGLAGAGLLR